MLAIAVLGNANPDPVPMQKLGQLIERGIWNIVCECTSGSTPVPTVPSGPPSGTPAINPSPIIVAPTVQTCMHVGLTNVAVPASSSVQWQWNSGAFLNTNVATPIPTGATWCAATVQAFDGGSVHGRYLWSVSYRNAAGANIGGGALGGTIKSPSSGGTDQTSATQATTIPAGAAYVLANFEPFTDNCTDTCTLVFDITCNGQPGQAVQPCCPPDPTAAGKLDSILRAVTLIQRQSVPFAYVASTAHSGLSGTGSIAVQGLIGVAVDVTTIPVALGVSAGTPLEYFDLGYVTFGTADGYQHSVRIEHPAQLVIPPFAGVFTSLAYTLHSGVVVTLTELVREP